MSLNSSECYFQHTLKADQGTYQHTSLLLGQHSLPLSIDGRSISSNYQHRNCLQDCKCAHMSSMSFACKILEGTHRDTSE